MEFINLDIGGTIFRFTRAALVQYPDTMLGAMFSKTVPGTNTYEHEGRKYYFFDRNPSVFYMVAEFYRTGRHAMLRPPECTWKMVAEELDFWCIPEVACSSVVVLDRIAPLVELMNYENAHANPIFISTGWMCHRTWSNQIPEGGDHPKKIIRGNPDKEKLNNILGVDVDKTAMVIGNLQDLYDSPSTIRDCLRRRGIDANVEFARVMCGRWMEIAYVDSAGKVDTHNLCIHAVINAVNILMQLVPYVSRRLTNVQRMTCE